MTRKNPQHKARKAAAKRKANAAQPKKPRQVAMIGHYSPSSPTMGLAIIAASAAMMTRGKRHDQ